jgi:RNA polymerase sigma-70 factor, ECF subfamily
MIPQDVVARARLGAPEDLERLAELAWQDAYKLAYAILGERHAAEDAAQEACVAACRNLVSLRSVEAFRVWFARIVVREATRIKRRTSPQPANEENVPFQATHAGEVATAVDVWRALDTLSPELRGVVVLRYFEDLTSREIGAVLGIPAPTVRFRLMAALRRLRPLLDVTDRLTPAPEVRSHAC